MTARSAVLVSAALAAVLHACSGGEVMDPLPTPIEIASVEVTPGVHTLLSLGDTARFTATAREADGTPVPGRTFQWASDDANVVTVDQSGVVLAVGNGSARITATAGGRSGEATTLVAQRPASLASVGGQVLSGPVGSTLGTPLVLRVADQRGNGIAGVDVAFSVLAGEGTIDDPNQTTGGLGEASALWTLGTMSGEHLARALVVADTTLDIEFRGVAIPESAEAVDSIVGDGQAGLVLAPLPDSIGAKVVDRFGNGVEGVEVTFTVTTGGGSVSPAVLTTDFFGHARAAWTLGAVTGTQEIQWAVAGVPTASWTASGHVLALSSVSPRPMLQGKTATLTGTFDPIPEYNTVTMDGDTLAISMASTTSITVMLPDVDCAPARDVDLRVLAASRPGADTGERIVRLNPTSNIVELAVGEQMIVQDPDDFCLHFLPGDSNAGLYVVGLTATAELNAELPFAFTAEAPLASPPPLVSIAETVGTNVSTSIPFLSASEQELTRTWGSHTAGEERIRSWERRYLPARLDAAGSSPMQRTATGPAAAPPLVGDVLTFHVPSSLSDVCSNPTLISAAVRAVGTYGIIATDVNHQIASLADTLTDADIQLLSDLWDDAYPVVTNYLGSPSDLDDNEHVVIVLTAEVNKLGKIAGFATAADFLEPSACASSDGGEVFYGVTADPTGGLGGIAQGRFQFERFLAPFVAHELAHTIQQSLRSGMGAPFMASWASEGQAELVKEMVGHDLLNNAPYMEYGGSVVNDKGFGFEWYGSSFESLGRYFGWNGDAKKVRDAPELCSLFGYTSGRVPCTVPYGHGVAWSFLRYVNDRFGPTYPGGEAGLQRDWISANPSLRGAAAVEALLAVEFDTLAAEWAAALWADGRVSLPSSPLQLSSWNLFDVFEGFPATHRLDPVSEPAQGFHQTRSVRGGSTAYLRFERVGSNPGLALRARDQSDRVLGGTLKPVLWIVRGS